MLGAFLAAVLIGLIVYIIAGLVPFLKPYQGLIALLVFLAVLISGGGFANL